MSRDKEWQQFHQKSVAEKTKLFKKEDRLFDVIYAEQFDRGLLEHLFGLADKVRKIAKTKIGMDFLSTILSDKRAMLFFVQPSTRTFLSFLNACQVLGMRTSEIRDASTSSEIKGESQEDTIRTFSSYVDLIITRHNNEGFAERAAWSLNSYANRPIPVINAGSGKDQHPTQALLDMYTIQRELSKLGGTDNKTILMTGDLKRGRTVRSLCRLLALYNNVKIIFSSPKEFQMRDDILKFLDSKKISYIVSDEFEKHLKSADAIYCTRIQDEHDNNKESGKVDISKFELRKEHLDLLQKHTLILHPFPRRNEISVDIDSDERAMYWKQARNGMWIRIALILYLFKREDYIEAFPIGD